MLSLRQLRSWFRDLDLVLQDIVLSADMLRKILNPENKAEEEALGDTFFTHYRKLLEFTLVVQLCKLFLASDIERRNFRKLFNRLKYDKYDDRLKQRLRENRGHPGRLAYKAEIKEFLKPWAAKIEAGDELIHRMKILRDRVYAHTDPARSVPPVHSSELLELCELAMELYAALKLALFNEDFSRPAAGNKLPPCLLLDGGASR